MIAALVTGQLRREQKASKETRLLQSKGDEMDDEEEELWIYFKVKTSRI